MATAMTQQTGREVARPLKVLVPLIKEDLESGREASERAGLPYYRAAGEKMIEAKEQIAPTVRPQAWHEPVKQIIGRVDLETLRDAELKRADEREAERKLALQLIDIG